MNSKLNLETLVKNESENSIEKYVDKAKLRRKEVGIDYSHLASDIVEQSSTRIAISQNNIGAKILKKMGYVEGKGLGLYEQGIIEPVGFFLLRSFINKNN